MPNLKLSVNYRFPLGPQLTQIEGMRKVVLSFLEGVVAGRVPADSVKYAYNDTVAVGAQAYGGQAAGLLVLSGGAGAVGGTIGGTAVTTTFATSDTVTSTALVAAIKANATVNLFCTATNKLAQMTCVSVLAGTTIEIWNTKFTSIANGVAPTAFDTWSIGASDTACALNLATAINQHPSLAGRIRAVSIAGVVFVGVVDDRVPTKYEVIINPRTAAGAAATTITVNAPIPVVGPRTMVLANEYGVIGNFVDMVASGTGMTFSTNGAAAKLGGGTGGYTPALTQDVLP